jgi:hypothetical protein
VRDKRSRHGWSPPTCALTGMRHAAACGRCGMRGRPCRLNSCMRGRRPGAIPFLEHIIFCVGTMHVEEKLLPLTQLHAVERAVLTNARLREQGVQAGARHWGEHIGGGKAQQSWRTARPGKRGIASGCSGPHPFFKLWFCTSMSSIW